MKKIRYIFAAILCCLQGVSFCFPVFVSAEEDTQGPIIITEMMPGTATSGSQEFIELYNQSAAAINLAAQNWQVQIVTSKATSWDKPKIVRLQGVLQPGAYLILSSSYIVPGETKSYLQDYANAQFTSGLVAGSGHIRLVYTNGPVLSTADRLEWTTQENGEFVSPPIDDTPPKLLDESLQAGTSLKRLITDGVFSTSHDNDADFISSACPSPTSLNIEPVERPNAPIPTTVDITNQRCVTEPEEESENPIPQPESEPPATLLPPENISPKTTTTTPKIPSSNTGLSAPQLTELLPNPGSPQTDAEDEFIELYNSNATSYDLSGYMLRIGATGSKKYTFPTGTKLPAKGFVAFFSADTRISLSNSAGRVILLDPLEREISKTDTYTTAKDSQSWARAQGKWQWTTKPSPNAENIISVPAVTKKASAGKATAPKTAGTASAKKTQPESAQNVSGTAEAEQKSPVHPLALAVVGGFALLYGAYEYRRDMANKFYQFRSYRAARREDRAQLEGR